MHFKCYEEVAKRLGKLLGVDPWLIHPVFERCAGIDVGRPADLDRLGAQVDAVLTKVRRKYKEYGIKEKPFVVVKSDNGSRDIGIVTVRDARNLAELGQTLQSRTGATGPQDLLVQEGVLTRERINDAVAEPVVYMMDRYVVGGFYRIHADRGVDEDLSAPGASFVPLAFEQSTHLPQPGVKPGASVPNRFYMYGVVARLAMLAASYELEATDPEAENFV
jgi:glutamate--cysteine ligase